MTCPRCCCTLALAGLLGAGPAGAGWGENLGLAVDIRRDSQAWDYPEQRITTRSTRLGLHLYEPSLPAFQPGLRLGRLWVSQSGNPATAGLDLGGQYLGAVLDSEWFASAPLGLRARAAYTALEARDSSDEQTTRLRWYEAELRLAAGLRLHPVELDLGGYHRWLEGDEIARGALSHTQAVERAGGGVYLEVRYWTDATGSVSARFEQGLGTAFELRFARAF